MWAAPSAGYALAAGISLTDLLRPRWIPARARITMTMTMQMSSPRPVVHLELHTGDQARASAFYANLLGWQPNDDDRGLNVGPERLARC